MQSKNYYLKDLRLPREAAVDAFEVNIDTDNPKIKCKIFVHNAGDGMYEIIAVEAWSIALTDLIERRYIGKKFKPKKMDIRLRDAQYETRKEAEKSKWDGYDGAPDYYRHSTQYRTMQLINELVKNTREYDWEGTEKAKTPKSKKPAERPTSPEKGSLEDMIRGLVVDAVTSGKSKEFIRETILRNMDDWKPEVRPVELRFPDGEVKVVGRQHKEFENVMLSMGCRVSLALVGEAGSGKTTAVIKAAEALGLKFYTKSVSAQTGVHEFFGYQDANGNYVRTLFREAYEFGGVFLIDEFDAGNPNVLSSLNQATAQYAAAFADGMVEKHPDFVCMAAGNTYGNGATADYVGRNPIDKATLDRFVFLEFGYDEKFEYDLATNKEWCKKVQAMRANARRKKVRAIISPRATFNGAKLLEAGIPEEKVMDMCVFKDMTPDERALVSVA